MGTHYRKYEKKVKAGIAFMDVIAPAGWRKKLNKEELNIASFTRCALGQIFRQNGGQEPWYLDNDELYDALGFDILGLDFRSLDDPNIRSQYRALTTEWKRQLSE